MDVGYPTSQRTLSFFYYCFLQCPVRMIGVWDFVFNSHSLISDVLNDLTHTDLNNKPSDVHFSIYDVLYVRYTSGLCVVSEWQLR